MGLLSKGTPLEWEDSKQFHAYVKEHGVVQFLNLWNRLKQRPDDEFKWGDEVEYLVVSVDRARRTVRLALRANEIIGALNDSAAAIRAAAEARAAAGNGPPPPPFHAVFLPEYANYMVEATPGEPYLNTSADLRLVELNQRLRRQMIEKALRPNERVLSLGAFPRLGVGRYTEPAVATGGPVTESRYIGDGIISPHPRFATLTRNIRTRRGSRVDIRVPLFQDERTAETAARELAEAGGSLPYDPAREVHMDAMGFGMGCCCLQVTFQARNVGEARRLYDHLAVLSPILLALTASTPLYRGKISDNDVRWTVISQSVDDRTPAERGDAPPEGSPYGAINKSRYDSIDSYLSTDGRLRPEYNDLDLVFDQRTRDSLVEGGVDELLARHVAHLFIRDPLALYGELIHLDDEKSSDHFENLQSTNWQTVRFKPPPAGADHIGWRVEFRSMEVQVTDFGNAAFTVLIALLSRAILYFDLNLYVPITKVDENMRRAHRNDASRGERFFFRTVIQGCPPEAGDGPVEGEYEEMTMEEIMHGRAPDFPGLLPVVRRYLEAIGADRETMETVGRYLDFVGDRASGRLVTPAQWFRTFARSHPSYGMDSTVTEEMQHDLLDACHAVSAGTLRPASLLGDYPHASPAPGQASAPVPLQGAGCFELNLADPNKKPCEAIKELLHSHLRR